MLSMDRRSSGALEEGPLPFFIDEEKKQDGRLFPNYPLYYEGLPKPAARGYLHFVCALLLPLGFWHFSIVVGSNIWGLVSGFFYLCTNLYCYGMSGIYHIGKWSIQTEILLQKLDHCGIALLSCGTMIPASVMLLDFPYGLLLGGSTASCCLWTCWHILHGRPSVMRQAMVPACVLPFLPLLYNKMTALEYFCTWATIVLQTSGMVVFVHEKPDILPAIFGYHELFHLLVTMAGVCVYVCNWSILHRTCGGEGDIHDLYFGSIKLI